MKFVITLQRHDAGETVGVSVVSIDCSRAGADLAYPDFDTMVSWAKTYPEALRFAQARALDQLANWLKYKADREDVLAEPMLEVRFQTVGQETVAAAMKGEKRSMPAQYLSAAELKGQIGYDWEATDAANIQHFLHFFEGYRDAWALNVGCPYSPRTARAESWEAGHAFAQKDRGHE